jgi:small subunit ribosomal protein S1
MATNDQPDEPLEDNGDTSFADMLAAYGDRAQGAVEVGQRLSVPIIAIGEQSVFVDTGTKIDGVVDKGELLDAEGGFNYSVGDVLNLYVVEANESEIRLSQALAGEGGVAMLRDAQQSGLPVEGRVQAACKGGFEVQVLKKRAFCPASQMDTRPVSAEEAARYIGQQMSFLILRLEDRGRNIVVSRRALLEREQAKGREQFLETTHPGEVVAGRVVRLMPFGAFMELVPGVEGLVHVSELDWRRVERPEEVVAVGQTLPVRILKIERPEDPKGLRISLSVKQAGDDPWVAHIDQLSEGAVVPAVITRCAPFGAFAELVPGIEGLIHISEMSYARRVNKAEEVVSPGEAVSVRIKSIDRERRRIALSLREVAGDPWATAATRYKVGQPVEGTVEKQEKFGLFVTLEPGLTGLVPRSKISEDDDAQRFQGLRPGDRITLVVDALRPEERRLTLAPASSVERNDWRNHPAAEGTGALGTLAEKLQQAMAGRKTNGS